MAGSCGNSSAGKLDVWTRDAMVRLAAVLPAPGRLVVARLDATRMTDADHAFYELSDALLFPRHFGWNWDALSDCLRDLNWLPADGYLVVVENAPWLLSSSAEDRHTLFRVLTRAVDHWTNPLGRPDGKGIPFKVLLLCDRDEEAVLLRREIADASRTTR